MPREGKSEFNRTNDFTVPGAVVPSGHLNCVTMSEMSATPGKDCTSRRAIFAVIMGAVDGSIDRMTGSGAT